MALDIPHNMPILPSTRNGYSIRRVGDPILMTRARILPSESPAGGERAEGESGKTAKKKPAEALNSFEQLDPDAFAREALSINGYRDGILRGEPAPGGDPGEKANAVAEQEEFEFVEARPGEEPSSQRAPTGGGLLGLVMSRYLPALSGPEGSGFLAYA